MDKRGLKVLRYNLKAFIESDPVQLILLRSERVETAAGGYRVVDPPSEVPPQTFRVSPFKRRLSNSLVNTEDGDIPVADYILTGFWNADIQRWDTFEYNGEPYMVTFIEQRSQDRQSADKITAQVVTRARGLAWQTKAASSS